MSTAKKSLYLRHREEQKKIVKNCLQWGLKPIPLDHEANTLPTITNLIIDATQKLRFDWFLMVVQILIYS